MDPGSLDGVKNQAEVVPTTPAPRLVRGVGHPDMVQVSTTMTDVKRKELPGSL